MAFYSLSYLNASHLQERISATFEHGVHLDNKKDGEKWMSLYAYANYVIELVYNPVGNMVEDARDITLDVYCDRWGI